MTITNTGNTTENNIELSLPDDFSIANGLTNSCDVSSGAAVGIDDELIAGGSCDVTVTYTKNTATAQNTADINIEYDYNNGTAASPATAAVNYRVTQSTANLTLNPSTDQTYSSISSNNSDISTPISYTLTNSGEVAATNVVINTFGGTNASLFSVVSGAGTTCTGTLSNTSGSNSCSIETQFGPAANGSAGAKTATYAVSYTPYNGSGDTSYSNTVNLAGTVTAAPSATYASSITANTFTGGTGAQGDPFTGYTSTAYTVSVTYTNSSQVAATNFTTSYSSLPTDWTLSTHGCNNVAMAATTGSCTDVYTLNSATTGAHDLNLANATASWTDSSGSYTNQTVSGAGTVYTSLSAPPLSVTIASVTNWSTIMGSAYAFTATVAGGSTTVTPTVSNLTGNTVSPASCALDSAAPATSSCTFIVTPYTGTGNYSFWDPTNIANSTDVNDPAVINTYNSISLSIAATGTGTTINGSASPQTFSNITGTVIAPYVYLAADVPGDTATAGTGITWGASGTAVATRFEAGTQSGGGTCTDSQKDNLTGLEWMKAPTSTTYIWANAKIAPAIPASLCGYSDWRLPNINELRSLVNYAATQSGSTPAAWLSTQGFTNVQTDGYWSSTAYDGSNAWLVYFGGGTIGFVNTGYDYSVWPVRGGQ